MSEIYAEHRGIGGALEALGWEFDSQERGWNRGNGEKAASIRPHDAWDGWVSLRLIGGPVDPPIGPVVFFANHQVNAPAKFVLLSQRESICRLDVPTVTSGRASGCCGAGFDFRRSDPLSVWAEAITAYVDGRQADNEQVTQPVEHLVRDLKRTGWSASEEDGSVMVHLQVHDVYRNVEFRPAGPRGAVLWTEIVRLEDMPADARRAVIALAHELNARLPLVRVSSPEEGEPRTLNLEVYFGRGTVPPTWFTTAMETVETAVALAAREFQAVGRDPQLAQLVLATSVA